VAGKQVALIRGINVGKAKRVAMADLRALCEDLGYLEVRTLLNSGNVVFNSPRTPPAKSAASIERAISTKLGFSANVVVLSASELAGTVKENPLGNVATNPARLLVTFLKNPEDRNLLKPLAKQKWKPEALAVGSHAVYVWCPEGLLVSRLAAAVNRLLGDGATTRNWATVLKLHALADQS
jgi:uncharacterized protein (DUF1697 family)